MKYLILTKDGERHVVNDLSGYEDYTLLQTDVPEVEHAKIVKGKLVEDKARANAKPRPTLESLETRIEALEAIVTKTGSK